MLFDIRPKKRKEDLFGREKELEELMSSVEPIVLVYGIRRIGKTSLLNVFCNEIKRCVFVDARWVSSYDDLVTGIVDNVSLIDEIKLKTPILEITKRGRKIERLKQAFEALNESGATLVIDEAQELRYLKDIRKILAWSYDNLDNLKVILSGSEVGVLEEFVGVDNYDSPLYGRAMKELRLERFDESKSMEFMRKGFLEYGMDVDEGEMKEVYEIMGGIVGWLTYYGHFRAEGRLDHLKALEEVRRTAKGLVRRELTRFLESRKTAKKRYCCILKAISLGLSRWSDIKRYCNESNDKRFSEALRRLEKYSFIGRENGYHLLDPLMKDAVAEVCR